MPHPEANKYLNVNLSAPSIEPVPDELRDSLSINSALSHATSEAAKQNPLGVKFSAGTPVERLESFGDRIEDSPSLKEPGVAAAREAAYRQLGLDPRTGLPASEAVQQQSPDTAPQTGKDKDLPVLEGEIGQLSVAAGLQAHFSTSEQEQSANRAYGVIKQHFEGRPTSSNTVIHTDDSTEGVAYVERRLRDRIAVDDQPMSQDKSAHPRASTPTRHHASSSDGRSSQTSSPYGYVPGTRRGRLHRRQGR